MKVEIQEIVFMRENAPKNFQGFIMAYLKANGIEKNRTAIHTEIRTLKENYDEDIIKAARHVLKTIQKVEYKQTPCHQPQ